MPTITVELSEEIAADLEASAQQNGFASPAALLADLAADYYELRHPPEPPPEVLAEIRRRQETPLEDCIPLDEAFDALRAKLRDDDRREREDAE